MIMLTYLDVANTTSDIHYGYSSDLGLCKLYGNIIANSGDVLTLDGTLNSAINLTIITDILVKSVDKAIKHESVMDISEDICDYLTKCKSYFERVGYNPSLVRNVSLGMLPVFLGDKPKQEHANLIKQYLNQLCYYV